MLKKFSWRKTKDNFLPKPIETHGRVNSSLGLNKLLPSIKKLSSSFRKQAIA
jgi:hypothetical protein